MATFFSSNQYESDYWPHRLQNYEKPHAYKKNPDATKGFTRIIADDRGHLGMRMVRNHHNPLGTFVGTWDLPDHLPGPRVSVPTSRRHPVHDKMKRTLEEQEHVIWGMKKNANYSYRPMLNSKIFKHVRKPGRAGQISPCHGDPCKDIVNNMTVTTDLRSHKVDMSDNEDLSTYNQMEPHARKMNEPIGDSEDAYHLMMHSPDGRSGRSPRHVDYDASGGTGSPHSAGNRCPCTREPGGGDDERLSEMLAAMKTCPPHDGIPTKPLSPLCVVPSMDRTDPFLQPFMDHIGVQARFDSAAEGMLNCGPGESDNRGLVQGNRLPPCATPPKPAGRCIVTNRPNPDCVEQYMPECREAMLCDHFKRPKPASPTAYPCYGQREPLCTKTECPDRGFQDDAHYQTIEMRLPSPPRNARDESCAERTALYE